MMLPTNKPKFSQGLLACSITLALATQFAYANQTTENLSTITVTADESPQDQKVGEMKKTAKTLAKQQVQDSRDLVRYETGISVVETGRMGASGYSVRGVDENRVAITVDGLHQAETLSSQGFKELFEGYGNFNNIRNGVEMETIKQVSLNKGSNSVKSGSGSLGGSVIFETKDARDFLTEKNYHIGYKKGYSTADNQHLNSFTLAGRYKWFDILAVKTLRDGHELENFDYKTGKDIQGRRREKSDPYRIKQDSSLIKFAVSPTENHRFSFVFDDYKRRSQGHDFSYTLKPTTHIEIDEDASRHTNDESRRRNQAIVYENFNETPFWDTLKFSYSNQRIKNKARTDDYCSGGSNCKTLNNNPANLHLKDGVLVDGNNQEVVVDRDNSVGGLTAVKFNDQYYTTYNLKRTSDLWFDCSLFDCNKEHTFYKLPYSSPVEAVKQHFDKFFTDEQNRKFATVTNTSLNSVTMNGTGYIETLYHDRDLDTNAKQLNLDLTKSVQLFNTNHLLEYGLSYSKTEKSMTNRSGYKSLHHEWYAKPTLGPSPTDPTKTLKCENASSSDRWNALLCPTENTYSFLVPVVTKNKSLYFTDNFKFNDYLSFDLGYRYDRIKYMPEYVPGVSAKIPDDMIKELFVPLQAPTPFVAEELPYTPQPIPSFREYSTANPSASFFDFLAYARQLRSENEAGEVQNAAVRTRNAAGERQYQADLAAARAKNLQDNLDYFTKQKKYSAHSYSIATSIDPTDYLKLQLKYAKGFRTPTSDEIYFTFQHPDFSVLPNLNLKPEESKTQELALTWYGDYGFITGSVFKTKYRNFIDLTYNGKMERNPFGGNVRAQTYLLYQNVNQQNAKVTGFEINSKLHLGKLVNALNGFNLSYKFTYQKGKVNGNQPMNAIQPMTAVYGLGYQQRDDKFGLDLYVTHASAKKAKDSYNMYYKEEGKTDSTVKWRSGSYTTVDIIGYAKPIKNLTIQLGVYNLTNRKYLTWESARAIRSIGTANRIDQNSGEGINRFYSPGRNFKLSAELVF